MLFGTTLFDVLEKLPPIPVVIVALAAYALGGRIIRNLFTAAKILTAVVAGLVSVAVILSVLKITPVISTATSDVIPTDFAYAVFFGVILVLCVSVAVLGFGDWFSWGNDHGETALTRWPVCISLAFGGLAGAVLSIIAVAYFANALISHGKP